MQLQYINIQRNPSYHDFPDLFTGKVKFNTGTSMGSIEVPLDHELSQKVLQLCAEAIVAASQTFAAAMTAETFTQLTVAAPK